MSRTWSKLQVSLLGLLDYNHSHLVSCCTFFYIMIMVYLDMKVEFWWNFKKNREKRERRETHLLTTKPKKGIKIFTLRCNCKVEEFRCNMGDEMINWFSVLDWFLTNYCPTWITICTCSRTLDHLCNQPYCKSELLSDTIYTLLLSRWDKWFVFES